jgi:predicted kinase
MVPRRLAPAERPADSKPLLVIVSGAPGAGKSTLASSLGVELQLPVVMKDTIKEALLDTLGAPTRARSSELSRASYAVMNAVAATVLVAGTGVVVEANFSHGASEAELSALLPHARGMQVHCSASPEVVAKRYRERADAGLRHPGHFDAEMLPEVMSRMGAGVYRPLDLPVPFLSVLTDDGYQPPFEAVVEFVRHI